MPSSGLEIQITDYTIDSQVACLLIIFSDLSGV